MSKNVSLLKGNRNNFPEFNDDLVYVPNQGVKLKDQIICSVDNIHLINVFKNYTNDKYWGCTFTSVVDSDNIVNMFLCKDRGLTEDLVDNKEAFVNFFSSKLYRKTLKNVERSEFKTIEPSFLQEYQVKFILRPDNTYYATTAIVNNTAFTRGLYGSTTKEDYIEDINDYGISIFNRFPTEQEVQKYIIDTQLEAVTANFISRVNTAYSSIKVYHRSEI
jgi:hypothetical protein